MAWYQKVVEFFIRDSAERRRFINEFNANARMGFQHLSVDALFEANTCEGNPDRSFRHELSAPLCVSGFEIKAKAGAVIPREDIILIGQIILMNEPIVRRMFVLHWDTIIVRDDRTGNCISWRIRDFINFGGLIY